MKIYFLSDRPCALRLGGIHFGYVDNFERFAQIQLSDRIFAEFIPENALPISFFITDEILHSPPRGCDVYILRDALVLYARDFPPADFSLRPITQIVEQNCTATLFMQGQIQLSIQTLENFFISYLPLSFCQAELFFYANLLFVKAEKMLAVFNKSGERLFMENILSYSLDGDVLSVKLPLVESLGRVADCKYALSPTECTRTECVLSQSRAERVEELFAFAFFESILIGADITEFLSDEMIPKTDGIYAFLGDFISVLPTETENCCALLYKKKEGLFEAKYFTLAVKNRKVTDITA